MSPTGAAEPPYLRHGNRQRRNIYRGEVFIGVMFHPADAEFIVSAVKYYLDYLSAQDDKVRAALARRHAERDARRRRAAEQADRVSRAIACQHPDYHTHGKCIGLKAHMNDGHGCLCPCHDNDFVPDPKEGA